MSVAKPTVHPEAGEHLPQRPVDLGRALGLADSALHEIHQPVVEVERSVDIGRPRPLGDLGLDLSDVTLMINTLAVDLLAFLERDVGR
jgi:hypothetical protein